MIHQLFRVFNWLGSEWILVILSLLSIVTVWVVLQKWMELERLAKTSDRFWNERVEAWFLESDHTAWRKETVELKAAYPCLETDLLDVLARAGNQEEGESEKLMAAYLESRKLKIEKLVGILGTIGANAPFIGLLGTVLGIIRAFHELASKGMGGGMETAMSGISEALVATAVGLFVAVPSVVFFNILSKRIGVLIRRAQSVGLLALSGKRSHSRGEK
jgi:biopolymer transport protein ExbB/TolQ